MHITCSQITAYIITVYYANYIVAVTVLSMLNVGCILRMQIWN